MNVFETCPTFESCRFLLRPVVREDCSDLLKVYSDTLALPLFNSDNCNGDDFHYTTYERMEQAVLFWLWSYDNGWFVRWSIVDKAEGCVVGTTELCFQNTKNPENLRGVLRLDLRSDYESQTELEDILSLLAAPCLAWFGCARVITKAKPIARERRAALENLGFIPMEEPLTGHDGTLYWDYYVKEK